MRPHGLGGLIVGDGGCTCPGDVSKAFGGGADFVMLGGMLSGHDEGETEIVEEGGRKFVSFYGMSSAEAMTRYAGALQTIEHPKARLFLDLTEALWRLHSSMFWGNSVDLHLRWGWPTQRVVEANDVCSGTRARKSGV